MSGTKELELELEQERRAEEMRKAALTAARADLEDRLSTLNGRTEKLLASTPELAKAAARTVHALGARKVELERLGDARCEDWHDLVEQASEIDGVAGELAHFLYRVNSEDRSLTWKHYIGRLEHVHDLGGFRELAEDVRKAPPPLVEERERRDAANALALLRRCVDTGISLPKAAHAALDALNDFQRTGDLRSAREGTSKFSMVPRKALEDSLRARFVEVLDVLALLSEGTWTERLREWRSTLPEELSQLRADIQDRKWEKFRSLRVEVDRILVERARFRFEAVIAAARKSGLQVEDERREGGVFEARITACNGWKAHVHEEAPTFWTIVGASERVEIVGPRDRRMEDCLQQGLGGIRDELRRAGAVAEILPGGSAVLSPPLKSSLATSR